MIRRLIEFAEKGFVVVSLLLSTGGPITLLRLAGAKDEGLQEGNDSLLQLLFFGIYAVSFFLIARRWKHVARQLLARDKLIWLVLSLVVASALWSPDPATTLRRSFALVGTTLFGVYLATRYNLKQQLQLLSAAFGLAVLMSMLFGIALRNYGVMHGLHEGAWRGIYLHKNGLGGMMVLSSIHFLILLIGNDRKKWTMWAGLIFSVLLILLSTSKTALVIFITLVAVLPLYRSLRWRYDLMIPFLLGVSVVVGGASAFFGENIESLLRLIGRDATLTGRTDIWQYIWDMIEKSPWLGYGYSGFWGDWNSPGAYIWYATGWKVAHAHNGILELLLNIGFLGAFLYVIGFVITFSRTITLLRITKTSEYLWPVMFLTWFILSNISEKTFMSYNSIFWILYVMVTLSVPRQFSQVNKSGYQNTYSNPI